MWTFHVPSENLIAHRQYLSTKLSFIAEFHCRSACIFPAKHTQKLHDNMLCTKSCVSLQSGIVQRHKRVDFIPIRFTSTRHRRRTALMLNGLGIIPDFIEPLWSRAQTLCAIHRSCWFQFHRLYRYNAGGGAMLRPKWNDRTLAFSRLRLFPANVCASQDDVSMLLFFLYTLNTHTSVQGWSGPNLNGPTRLDLDSFGVSLAYRHAAQSVAAQDNAQFLWAQPKSRNLQILSSTTRTCSVEILFKPNGRNMHCVISSL